MHVEVRARGRAGGPGRLSKKYFGPGRARFPRTGPGRAKFFRDFRAGPNRAILADPWSLGTYIGPFIFDRSVFAKTDPMFF